MPFGKEDYPGKEKAQSVAKNREKKKQERSDRAKKLLHDKGDSMSRSEKAFVGNFLNPWKMEDEN